MTIEIMCIVEARTAFGRWINRLLKIKNRIVKYELECDQMPFPTIKTAAKSFTIYTGKIVKVEEVRK